MTNQEIRALKDEAASQGDDPMVHCCSVALGEREPGTGGQQWPASQAEAIAECARVAAHTKAQDD